MSMRILVLLKMVPDVVEELEVADDGKSLDLEFLRLIVNETDQHALEQALILRDRHEGSVTVVALESPEIDEVLYSALAQGADRTIKITDLGGSFTTRLAAILFSELLPGIPGLLPVDLVLTGCHAIDDLGAPGAPHLAHMLGLPYVSVVTAVQVDPAGASAVVTKEYAGGVRGEFEVTLPAALGIQAAEKPPRYVPVSKVRAAMKSKTIEEVSAEGRLGVGRVAIRRMTKPEVTSHAEMIAGTPEEAALRVRAILEEHGVI